MLYCAKCKVMVDATERCKFCGNKKIREPKVNDELYLTTKVSHYAGMLEDLLKQNGIPYLRQQMGIGFLRGAIDIGTYKYYVPYGAYEKSKQLIDAFFKK